MKSLLMALAFMPILAMAQAFPSKPIRLVVTFPPGGTADIIARTVSDEMAPHLGVTVVVENKAGGAGGSVGTLDIARARPDGYTIGIATVGTHGTAPAVNPKLQYDPLTDFSYISNLAAMPMLLAVGPSVKETSFDAFLANARANQGKTTFATGGLGGVAHLMGERFQVSADVKMMHVPYRGANPALSDVAGGQVDAVFDALASSAPFLDGGRVRAIVVSGDKRLAAYPDVPTFAEVGLPDVGTRAWYGLVAPAGVPQELIDKLSEAARAALAVPAVQKRLEQLSAEAIGSTSAEFQRQVADELGQWRQIAQSQDIVLD